MNSERYSASNSVGQSSCLLSNKSGVRLLPGTNIASALVLLLLLCSCSLSFKSITLDKHYERTIYNNLTSKNISVIKLNIEYQMHR